MAGPQSKIFIAVAGNIGAGKTTLTHELSKRFGWEPHYESVADNPYLVDFYSDMRRWAFSLQVYFLNHRFQTHQKITAGTSSAIQDRSVYEDAHIFARGLSDQGAIEERDYRNYLGLFNIMTQYLDPPDLIVYLRKSVPKLQERISKRGRDYEQAITADYLTKLNLYYDEWMEHYNVGRKLIIDSDQLDIFNNTNHFDLVARLITESLDQKDLFFERSVSFSVNA